MNHSILRKVAAATAIVCDELGGSVNMFPLIKILYVADRQMIADYGHPITGDSYCSMPKGPVLSETYNFIRGKSKLTVLQQRWSEAFSTTGNLVKPKGKVNTDCLAPVEQKALRENARLIQSIMKTANLADWMHENCPEWQPVAEHSSKPLPLDRVVKISMSVDDSKAKEISDSIKAGFRQLARSKLSSVPLLQSSDSNRRRVRPQSVAA